MKTKNYADIHPRTVANKSSKQNLLDAIQMALEVESDAVRRNTNVFNTNRYTATARLDDYQELKDKARAIKERALADLPNLIDRLRKSINARGGHFFLAKTADEANQYIKNICLEKEAKLIVKAKSITSEEIGLNPVLENSGVEIAETDLAEFILQISKEQPSHNVGPAIHQSRERISKLFKDHFKTDLSLETGEDLTKFARDILRQKFISADIGISGANCIAADSGSILLVESEGNIRLTTHLPATHIAISGIEKIIHHYSDLAVFVELLAASGTGQSLSSYTNIITPPIEAPILNLNGRTDSQREFHLVLIDNGRSAMLEDPVFLEALYCIRCGACMNVCANFQNVGGHAFGGEYYSGGIGGAWMAGTSGDIKKARFAELCTGCSRCIPNCPVKINIPGLNTEIKNRLMKMEGGPSIQKKFFANFSTMAKFTAPIANLSNPLSNLSLSKFALNKLVGYDKRRPVPEISSPTLEKVYRKYRKDHNQKIESKIKTILFADVFTNFNNAQVGMALIRIYDNLGIDITISKTMDDGRAMLSQGIIDGAGKLAKKLTPYLIELIESGRDVIVAEPSVLAMFLQEYESFIDNRAELQLLLEHCYDPIQYLNKLIASKKIELPQVTPKNDRSDLFYHGHCQLKSIGLGGEVSKFFTHLGLQIIESNAECCGMAGSFGYKKDYYDLSKKVGARLGEEIREAGFADESKIILASGASCREQIHDEIDKSALHPIEHILKIIE